MEKIVQWLKSIKKEDELRKRIMARQMELSSSEVCDGLTRGSKLKRGKKEGPKPAPPAQPAPPTPASSATTASAAPSPSPPPVPAASSQPVSSDTAPPIQSLPERLWNRAYDDLKEESSGLVDTYEKLLSRELESDPSSTDLTSQKNKIEQKNPEIRRDQMSRLVTTGLKKIEREIKIKENIEEGIQPVFSAKEVIDTVVKAYPEASFAWAGICCALQLSRLLLDENRDDWKSAGLRGELEKHVIDLYKTLLLYQMKSVYSYYRSRNVVFWRDVIKLDDWDGSLTTIKSAENIIRQDAFAYNIESIKGHFEKLVEAAKFQQKLFPDIHQSIQDQTAAQWEMRQEKKNEKQEEKNKECLADLRVTDPRGDKKRIEDTKGGLFPDSSNWILEHEDFQRWRNNDEARLLWIKGDPGKGKTMLLIAIVDELEKQLAHQGPSAALSYFFCQGTNKDLNNAAAVLRGLVYLLGSKYPSLVSHLRKRYDNARSKLFKDANAFFALSEVLEDMLRDTSLSRAYIVIDALDECGMSDEHGTDLPRLLKFIAQHSSVSPHVKWVISSRNRPDIEQQLKLDNSGIKLSLELTQNAEQVAHAVNAYIDFKASRLWPLQDRNTLEENILATRRDEVREVMRRKSNGTFLWAALVFVELQDVLVGEVLEVLEEIPSGLTELYDRMIEQIRHLKPKHREYCYRVLSTATLAYRPLHLLELQVLAGFQDGITYLTDLMRIVKMCGSFLTIQDDYVYLIHQSVKDYLSGKASSIIFPSGPTDVHSAIFSQSLQVMSVTLRRDIYNLHYPGLSINKVETPDPDPLAAIRYSCVHWIGHFCDVYGNSRPEDQIRLHLVEQFLREFFLYWLEALGLIQHMGDTVKIWDTATGYLQQTLEGHSDSVLSVAFSHDSKLLASGSYDKTVKIWDTATGFLQQTFEGHNDLINSVAFSHDSKLLASGSHDNTVKIWNTATWSLQQMFEGHSDSVLSVAFSHDSKLLASGSYDRTVKIWDTATGFLQQTLKGHGHSVWSVTFSYDSKLLASGSYDDTVKIWDAVTGSLQQTLEDHYNRVKSVAFSHDSKLLASGSFDNTAKIWDTATGSLQQTLEGHSDSVSSVTFSHDSKLLASGSFDSTVKIWDAATGSLQQTLEGYSDSVSSVAFSHDSKLLASDSDDKTVKIWDMATGGLQQTLEGHSDSVFSVAFSHDSKLLASGSFDNTVKIWYAATGSLQQTLEGHNDLIISVTFSHDSELLASGSYDKTVKIWDTATGFLQQTFEGHTDSVNSVAFSHDSKLLASGSYDRTVKIWDAATGSLQQTFDLGIILLGQKEASRHPELRIRIKPRKHNIMATP
ncbi:hypothetical protein DL768_010007 [Monosporascus sp. mg162]|nr:hypothetical protein DL768_010007 [Monosporascus sp. mg162]